MHVYIYIYIQTYIHTYIIRSEAPSEPAVRALGLGSGGHSTITYDVV